MADGDSFSEPERELSEDIDLSISTTKSNEQKKRERIRDNQRRSRARRQEHLADLEKRLADCHSSMREAELQHAAYQDVQIENARLRDLLRIAGVNEAFTHDYVSRGMIRQPDGSVVQSQIGSQWGVALPPQLPSSVLPLGEERKSFDARDDSSRASPFSDVSSMSMSMSMPALTAGMGGMAVRPHLEAPHHGSLSQPPLSPAMVSPRYSPSPQQLPLQSQALQLEPHILHHPQMQNLSIYQPVSPQQHQHHHQQQQQQQQRQSQLIPARNYKIDEFSPDPHPSYRY